jgi:nitroreductase
MGTFARLAANRCSVRAFTETPVEQEKLDQLLEMVSIAPTACNNQPQRLIAVTEPDKLALIDKCTPCRNGAPLVFVVCYDQDTCWVRSFDGAKSGVVDASIVATHLLLEATDLGLGSLWVMHFDPALLRELFALDDNVIPVAVLPIGYTAPDFEVNPQHTTSKPIEELLLS